MMRIAGIGGGTGLPTLMRGLTRLAEAGEVESLGLTAVVCVSDDGGSSGRLRRTFQIPAVGDIRNTLLGLARGSSPWSALFAHRFASGKGLAGHSLGNLILTALCQQTGGLRKAIDLVADSMHVGGTVLPATEAFVTLCAEGADGRRARGECAIVAKRMRVARVWLEPGSPPAARGVLDALESADVIVLGPGSLFTSVIPPLLVAGVAEAIRGSGALRVYICNLMGEPGETDGFTAADHVRALVAHLGPQAIDVCVLSTAVPRGPMALRYRSAGATPVHPDFDEIRALGLVAIGADLLAQEGPKARHEPMALGRLVLELARAREVRRARPTPGRELTSCAVEPGSC